MNRRKTIPVRLALLVLVTAAAASCANRNVTYKPVPIPQDISQGNTFVLLTSIEIPKGSTALYFQGGRVLSKDEISGDAPYCRLDFARPAPRKLTIQPQGFDVTNVDYDDRSQGTDEQKSTTSFALKAEKGPAAKRMACGRPLASTRVDFLTPDEIGAALNGIFSIEVLN